MGGDCFWGCGECDLFDDERFWRGDRFLGMWEGDRFLGNVRGDRFWDMGNAIVFL